MKNRVCRSMAFVGQLRNALCAAALLGSSSMALAVTLADAPLFSTVAVPGNLALVLSVEWPTATTPGYTSSYSASSTFIGYFDSEKCYTYSYNSSTPSNSYFVPYGYAGSYVASTNTSNHTCATATSSIQLWSGNYLNWAAMQTLDTFRWVLTGGYRSTDTTTETRLTKTYAAVDGSNADKTLSSGISGATPFTWTSATTRIRNLGTAMYITSSGNVSSGAPVDYNGQNNAVSSSNSAYAASGTVYKVYINVQVCNSSVGVESNCVLYGSNYKPEGLLQKYSQKLRYSAFGYYNDSTGSPQRDGGILRAKMKYIAPTQPVPGSSATTNSATEWDATTGVMNGNPDSSDATATQTLATAAGYTVSITNSGVMNYLNKFGYSAQGYKSYDPVGELYYTAIRYFKNLGNVSTYTSLTSAGSSSTASTWLDGFPAITTWSDPISYSCQKNFILGIGDINTWTDADLPGSVLTSGNEPSTPTEITNDTSVNVGTATNMVGKMEGYSGNLGSQWVSSGRNDTYYIAGLAYDSHTKDIRTDLSGTQTISTYMMDVHENQVYGHKNEFWLAAKYGGFTVPTGFSTYASSNTTTTIPLTSWYTNTDTLPTTGTTYQSMLSYSTDASSNTSDRRPDNYFPGNSPQTMKTGLENAFSKIVSEAATATSTVISSPTPRASASGNANYTVTYDPNKWTSTLTGQLVTYDTSGNPTRTEQWNATTLLDARTSADRLIVTCCTSTGSALAFTNTSLTGATLNARTYYASFGSVPDVASGSQSIPNYIGYLRGTRTNEVGNSGPFRTRTHLLGDIVNSGLTAVGAPSSPYFEIYNPGYSAFKSTYASRPTVVYVGANDGMMHAIDGTMPATSGGTCTSTLTTPSTTCGKELFAYIPSFIYGTSSTAATLGLASLGDPTSFSHHYLVDATPVYADVDFFNTNSPTATANDWRTILVGGLGKGGQGYYAIDITNPANWTSESAVAGNVLWEFTNAHMGYSFGQPIIVKTPQYGWTVILPSGYNNDDGNGYLFFINPRNGALLNTVQISASSSSTPLNLGSIQAYSPDFSDFTADSVYAGDLQGNIWRTDLTATKTATTVSGTTTTTTSYTYTTLKLATLANSAGNPQPITTLPLVEPDSSSGKRYILVGTGQLLSDSDVSSTQLQSFYAVIDGTKGAGKFYNNAITSTSGATTTTNSGIAYPSGITPPVTRSVLVANTDLTAGISSSAAASKPMGWYFDLSANSSGTAERINIQPVSTTDGVVAFTANLPSGNVCSPAGSSRVFAADFTSGTSVLTDSSGNTVASLSLTTSVTDLVFQKNQGTTVIQAGDTSGGITPISPGTPAATHYKRLNWREVPTAN